MDSKIAQQILDELAPSFERIESQSAAILQFLKEKGIASDEQLAPYFEEASAASSVRWRALRVRMGRLLSMAEKNEDEKKAEEVNGRKSAKEAGSGAQVADAKKDKLDRAHENAPSSEKRVEAGDQDAGAIPGESDRDLAGRPKESARKKDSGLTSPEGSRQPPAESAPNANKRNDAA